MIQKLENYTSIEAESEVMILCSLPVLNKKQMVQLRELVIQVGFDWNIFFTLIVQSGVRVLVLNNLLKCVRDDLPKDILERVRQIIQFNLFRNLKVVAQLRRVIALLNKNNIEVIPWKGPLLSFILFGETTTRTSSDLDVLIKSDNLWKAKQLLEQEGYTPFWKMDKEQEQVYVKYRHSYEFLKEGKTDIELHWKLTKDQYYFPISMEEIWKTSKKQQFLDESIRVPTKENMIIGIALHHGGVECWLKYKLLVDFFYLLNVYENIDWNILLKKANELGVRRILIVGMLLCQSIFDYEIPAIFKKEIGKKDLELAKKIIANIFSKNTLVKQSSLLIELRENKTDRIKVAYKIMATPSLMDEYASVLPKWLTILERPIRLINKFIFEKDDELLEKYSNRQ